ncbi:MAG TPA: GNAT family N-acetyltransferase [Aeromicrobium sp.]|nr:GNAT family N-acetyltransferase [Aeromicrobium sp.]
MPGADAPIAAEISFRPLESDDLMLLAGWLGEPHVHRWWYQDPANVTADFGPALRGEEPGENLVALVDAQPVGLVQRSLIAAFAEDHEPLQRLVEVPDGAYSIDYLVGDVGLTGAGLGPRMIRAAVDDLWDRQPEATCVIVPVAAANRASWRALEHAGFQRIGTGWLTPDNPIDDGSHVIYRIDRPTGTPE